jgi:predicted nucleic acid-binding protein
MNAADTNVFVYALSGESDAKEPTAVALLRSLDPQHTIVPWQVACEVGAVIARQVAQGRIRADAFDAVPAMRRMFPVVLPSLAILEAGWAIHRGQQVSYWDAMLLAACAEAGVTRLYSEDMQSAPRIAGIEIINPFA